VGAADIPLVLENLDPSYGEVSQRLDLRALRVSSEQSIQFLAHVCSETTEENSKKLSPLDKKTD